MGTIKQSITINKVYVSQKYYTINKLLYIFCLLYLINKLLYRA